MNFKAKLLKKSLILLVLLLVAATAFAASGETIIIGGAVPLSLILTVDTSAYTHDNLDLSSATVANHNEPIADITITTNNTAGWELIAVSENHGITGATEMSNADGDDIAYTMTYAGTGGVTAAPTGTGVIIGENGASSAGDAGAELSITYNQSTTYPAGYYSDQVELILRAK